LIQIGCNEKPKKNKLETKVHEKKQLKKVESIKEKETFSLSDRLQFEMLINEKYGKYKVFETLLFYDDVCAASTYLFKDLKKTAYFDRAINSIINAPNIDITNQKSCGDSDLELLLQ